MYKTGVLEVKTQKRTVQVPGIVVQEIHLGNMQALRNLCCTRTPQPQPDTGEINVENTVYDEFIVRFMDRNCVECHGEAKMKGKLRLDTIADIKKGGKTENLIVHGNDEKSYLYELMVTDDEDEIMPPEGKLPDLRLELIKWWIDSSKTDADLYERKVKDANVPAKFMDMFKKGKAKMSGEAHKGANDSAKATDSVEKPAEKPVEKPAEPSTELAKVDFVKHIKPIFETTCIKCHGEKKQKGEYRMDTAEHIVKAGDSEEAPIVKGKPEESYLYKLVILDEDHDDIMPPKGDPLTKAQTALIKKWIEEGAEFPAGLQLKEVDPKAAGSTSGGAGIDFMKTIAPIFESRCIKCHGAKKQKGEYRMDKAEFVFTAGDSEEKPIVKGKPEESYLVKLIKMSEDDDDVMPPKGGLLTKEQIANIEQWIKEGAKFPADAALEDKSEK